MKKIEKGLELEKMVYAHKLKQIEQYCISEEITDQDTNSGQLRMLVKQILLEK